MQYIPLNFGLMSNPANWFVITLMVLLGGMVLAHVYHPADTGKEI